MARTISEILKSVGIGVKSPEQLEREQDPVLDKQFKRQIPTAEDWRISREYRARKAREKAQAAREAAMKQAGGTDFSVGPRPDYNPNVQYIEPTLDQPVDATVPTGDDNVYYNPVPRDAGQSRGGLFSDMFNQPTDYGPFKDRYGLRSEPEFPLAEEQGQANDFFGDYFRGQLAPDPNRNLLSDPESYDIKKVETNFPRLSRQGQVLISLGIQPTRQSDLNQVSETEKRNLAPNEDRRPAAARSGMVGPNDDRKQEYLSGEAKYSIPGLFKSIIDFYSQDGRRDDLPERITNNALYTPKGAFTSTAEAVYDAQQRINERKAREAAALAEQQRQDNLNWEGMATKEQSMDALPPDPPAIIQQEDDVIRSRQATLVDDAQSVKSLEDMNFSGNEWEQYKEAITDVESRGTGLYLARRKLDSGKYSQYLGRYQMGTKARYDAASDLGIPVPTEKEFLNNPELQDKMFLAYTRKNYRELMRISPEFRALPADEQKAVLAQAQLGATALARALKTGKPLEDSLKSKSTKWYKAVKKRFKTQGVDPSTNRIDPNMRGGFEGTGEF